jgi:hypothetical protein
MTAVVFVIVAAITSAFVFRLLRSKDRKDGK